MSYGKNDNRAEAGSPARPYKYRRFRSLRNLWRRETGDPVETDLTVYRRLVASLDDFDCAGMSDFELRARSRAIIEQARRAPAEERTDGGGRGAVRGAAGQKRRRVPNRTFPAENGVLRREEMISVFDRKDKESAPSAEKADDSFPDSDASPREDAAPRYPQLIIPEGPLDEALFSASRLPVPDDPRLPEVFALVREASRRTIGLDPFDVQMVTGAAMARGRIVELPTGEGKTLAAVFPAVLHALEGRGVHVLTFNDYLARRDATWMGPIYDWFGLSVGCVQEGQSPSEKRAAYAADVTYATAKECGFDYLRDGLAYSDAELVHRPFHTAIVDEADSILVDEARIPLVIAGVADRAAWDASRLTALVRRLDRGRDYETDAEHRNVFLTESGAARAEAFLGLSGGLYGAENTALLEALYCALHAEALLRRDVDYIVRRGRIEIIDEYTGRVVEKRHWPDGLQAAVEAKEGLARRSEGRILGSITLQYFFRLYPRLTGMTGTARSAASELRRFYGLDTAIVPAHVPSRRVDLPDAVFTHREAKRRALVDEIRRVHAAGRPVLVGTASVRESEELTAALKDAGVGCAVLNARHDEAEAAVVAQAGRPGAVTISTNMAGRGTDIKLGGADEAERERVIELGGLYVIGTNRHDSLRIDRQLRGRAGRQGDPGTTRFFISLEDELFKRYGLTAMFLKRHRLERRDCELRPGPIHSEIEHAQRIIEGQNFDIRISLSKYSSIVDIQRRIVRDKREEFRRGGASAAAGESGGEAGLLAVLDPEFRAAAAARLGEKRLAEVERRAALFHLDRLWSEHLAWVQDTRESIHLVGLGGRTPIEEFSGLATDEFLGLDGKFAAALVGEVRAAAESRDGFESSLDKLCGPSSTWAYLVNEDQFGWGMSLLSPRNIGFAAAAAGVWGPLLVLNLLVNKLLKRKKAPHESMESEGQDT